MKNALNIPEVDFTRPTSVDWDDLREMAREMAEVEDEDVSDQPTTIDWSRWDEISNRVATQYAERIRSTDPVMRWRS